MTASPARTRLQEEVHTEGFAIVEDVLSREQVSSLLRALEHVDDPVSVRRRSGVFAVRNLLDVSREIQDLTESELIRALIEPVLGPVFFPIRGILFDKIADANWNVPWHQDVTIAVQERFDVDGFGPWSIKSGVLHVQPPAPILEKMLTVRLHLDPCGEDNGALRVIPGSHQLGKIAEGSIEPFRRGSREHVCAVGVGGALLMRPLVLHASYPARVPGHRRVIHLDFASVSLPFGLKWSTDRTPRKRDIQPDKSR
jgi:ectoine hydroxylase-related dioxygenase (phytanoyl-CoA dioxygenase family)